MRLRVPTRVLLSKAARSPRLLVLGRERDPRVVVVCCSWHTAQVVQLRSAICSLHFDDHDHVSSLVSSRIHNPLLDSYHT